MDRELIYSMYGLTRRTGDCRYDCRDKACLVSTLVRSHRYDGHRYDDCRYGFDAKPWERGSSSYRFQFRTTAFFIVSLRTIQKSLVCRRFWIVRKLTMTNTVGFLRRQSETLRRQPGSSDCKSLYSNIRIANPNGRKLLDCFTAFAMTNAVVIADKWTKRKLLDCFTAFAMTNTVVIADEWTKRKLLDCFTAFAMTNAVVIADADEIIVLIFEINYF